MTTSTKQLLKVLAYLVVICLSPTIVAGVVWINSWLINRISDLI